MNIIRRFAVLMAITVLCGELAYAQAIPQRFSYQGIARNQSGTPLTNSAIGIRVSILDGSALGNTVYIETHQAVTNEFGLFTLQIGGGTPVLGNFAQVKWAADLKWMRVEVDLTGEGTYSILGVSQLLSVPYAIAAGTPLNMSLNDLTDVTITGSPAIGQALQWNGTTWTPGNGSSTVQVRPRLTGTGSAGDPLDIARQGAAFGQALKWNGTTWEPADDEGDDLTPGPGIDIINNAITHAPHTGDVTGSVELTVKGLLGRRLLNVPPVNGQVLKYSDGEGGWVPAADNSLTLIAGNGLNITGSTISGTQWTDAASNIYRAAGRVGIGTSAPLEQLHITDNFYFGKALMPNGTAGAAGDILTSDGANKAPVWKTATQVFGNAGWSLTGNAGTNAGVNFIGTTDANPLLVKTGGTERMRVTSTGNVGIGTGTPASKLQVSGDVYVDAVGSGIILKSPNGNCWRITVDNSGNLITTGITCP